MPRCAAPPLSRPGGFTARRSDRMLTVSGRSASICTRSTGVKLHTLAASTWALAVAQHGRSSLLHKMTQAASHPNPARVETYSGCDRQTIEFKLHEVTNEASNIMHIFCHRGLHLIPAVQSRVENEMQIVLWMKVKQAQKGMQVTSRMTPLPPRQRPAPPESGRRLNSRRTTG